MSLKIFLLLAHLLPNILALSQLKLQGPPSLPQTASHTLHPALGSFSIETAFFEEFIGNTSAPNVLTRNLLENLKARTGTPAEVRIGGITADSTYWNASQSLSLLNFIDNKGALQNTTIGPGFWQSVKLLPKGTKVVMNLDLRDLDYQGALSVAESALRGLGPDQLELLEIGNEPDHYHSFTPQNYSAIWGEWAKNMSDTLNLKAPRFQVAATVDDPLWPYDAPGASSQLSCVSALGAGANRDGVVRSCSEHTYQYSVCDPPRIAVATLPNLVNHTRLAQFLDLWQPRIKSVREQLGPHSFVMGEYNSVSCSGRNNVSNTFGQALWLLDTTFYGASLNISRMYIHQGGPLALQSSTQLNHGGLSFYDLWYPVPNTNGPVKVFPSYSAYLFVAEALGHSKSLRIANIYPGRQANGSTITTALGDQSAGELVAYGFWDDNMPSRHRFPVKLALLNLQIFNQTQTTPRPTSTFDISEYIQSPRRTVTVRRLTAPGADVQDANVTTWAGQHFASGVASGKLVEEKITVGKVVLKASEAVLVFL
ncbi:Beta-glucuronidase [Hypsizygus marmoreus]|uniref:Beta-glucuronidase n=1 Tax=Hypsizygus marmoreus TaxID=39966 RepID=A0A369JYG6_HYPMA|nr:Beta-glucuronidase [Hypsizygus marmoreus]